MKNIGTKITRKSVEKFSLLHFQIRLIVFLVLAYLKLHLFLTVHRHLRSESSEDFRKPLLSLILLYLH